MGRFLILSEAGNAAGLSIRLETEGHEPQVWIRALDADDLGKNIIKRAKEWRQAQTIIADVNNFGPLLDIFRDNGLHVFGGSCFADKLECDRQYAEEVMQEVGIDVPKSVRANSWEEASKAVDSLGKTNEKVVIKPEGDLSGVVPSVCAKSLEDAHSTLERFEKASSGSEVNVTIQEFIEGLAISTEGFFNGEQWIEGMFNHTLENKKSLNDDLGHTTGCAGNVVWPTDSKDPLVKQTLTKLTKLLEEHRYVGPFDINCVVNEDSVYGLEFTPRFGYDAFPTLLYTLFDDDFGAFVDAACMGSGLDGHLRGGFGVGLRLIVPPPLSSHAPSDPVFIRGLDKLEDLDHFYPYDVLFTEDKKLRSGKGHGSLGVLNHHGETIGEAFARLYELVSRIEAPNLQFRTDLCEVFQKEFRQLQEVMRGEEDEGWIGVDLDATLAEYGGWSDEIGEPIRKMVERVKRWIYEGKEVRILTARGTVGSMNEKYTQLVKIYDWIREHIGSPIEVTCQKDPKMIRLYDDRVVKVEANEGVLAN
jgi:phosphoribosylamine--glycine ligase